MKVNLEVCQEPVSVGLLDGGAERDRTADLVNAIHALSQLSYGPVPLGNRRGVRRARLTILLTGKVKCLAQALRFFCQAARFDARSVLRADML